MRRLRATLAVVAPALLVGGGLVACKPYVVEYHTRPEIYQVASEEDLPDRVTLDDGTVIIYNSPDSKAIAESKSDPNAKRFEPRIEHEDGTVTLQAATPEHVLMNTLGCLYNEEYELLWEQMLSRETKKELERLGEGQDEFVAHFRENREELASMLNRMLRGIAMHDAILENRGQGVLRYRFQPRVASLFQYDSVYIINEPPGLKLLTIR